MQHHKVTLDECDTISRRHTASELSKLENDFLTSPTAFEKCVRLHLSLYEFETRGDAVHMVIATVAFVVVLLLLSAADKNYNMLLVEFYQPSALPATIVYLYKIASNVEGIIFMAGLTVFTVWISIWMNCMRAKARNLIFSVEKHTFLELMEVISNYLTWVVISYIAIVTNAKITSVEGDPSKVAAFLAVVRHNIVWDVVLSSNALVVLIPAHLFGLEYTMICHTLSVLLIMYTAFVLWDTSTSCFSFLKKPKALCTSLVVPADHIWQQKLCRHEYLHSATAIITLFFYLVALSLVGILSRGTATDQIPLVLYEGFAAVIYGLQIIRRLLDVKLRPTPPRLPKDPPIEPDFDRQFDYPKH
ncbi:hypothetical protein Pelo_9927 [Pelomyxa schiedti]|nr:hypothetical protein Pelo_9927 [Pelomyxa schiedti]